MNKIIRYTTVWGLTLLTVSTITSCSKDDDNSNNSGIAETITNNTNSNLKDLRTATHRLEFPKLKGGHSTILTHKLSNGEINYSVEWDIEKMSNRWTCYQIYASNAQQAVKRKVNRVLTSILKTHCGLLIPSFHPILIIDLATTTAISVHHKTE